MRWLLTSDNVGDTFITSRRRSSRRGIRGRLTHAHLHAVAAHPCSCRQAASEAMYQSHVRGVPRSERSTAVIGGASYGAKGLKLPQFLLRPLQNFCVK